MRKRGRSWIVEIRLKQIFRFLWQEFANVNENCEFRIKENLAKGGEYQSSKKRTNWDRFIRFTWSYFLSFGRFLYNFCISFLGHFVPGIFKESRKRIRNGIGITSKVWTRYALRYIFRCDVEICGACGAWNIINITLVGSIKLMILWEWKRIIFIWSFYTYTWTCLVFYYTIKLNKLMILFDFTWP